MPRIQELKFCFDCGEPHQVDPHNLCEPVSRWLVWVGKFCKGRP